MTRWLLLILSAGALAAQTTVTVPTGCQVITSLTNAISFTPCTATPPAANPCLQAATGLPPMTTGPLPALPVGCNVPAYPKPTIAPVVVTTLASLQAAVNAAPCGGWIQASGGALGAGNFALSNNCPASNPILIENQNIRAACAAGSPAPCGTAAFPIGAPLFPASTTPAQALAGTSWVPTLAGNTTGSTVTFSDNAAGIFLAGFEITLAVGSPSNIYRPIVGMGEATTSIAALPHNIWLWQDLVHPAPCTADSLTAPCSYSGRGIDANLVTGGVYYVRVWGIVAPGQDTQAVLVNNSPGPVDVIGSYLEATGENLGLNTSCTLIAPGLSNPPPGTTQGSTGWLPGDLGIPTCPVPSNITANGNHFHKQTSWASLPAGCNPALSQCYDVKLSFECKYCSTVLLDSNYYDTTIPGGQSSFIALNCWATGLYVCQDVTVSNSVVAYGVQTANSLVGIGYFAGNGQPVSCLTCGYTGPAVNQTALRVLVRNVLAVAVSGAFFQIQNSNGVRLDHVTSINGSGFTTILNALDFSDGQPSTDLNFQITNTLFFGSPFNDAGGPVAITLLPSPVLGADYAVGDYWSYPNIWNVAYTPPYPVGFQSLSSPQISVAGNPPLTCRNNNSITQGCWSPDWALVGMMDFIGASLGTDLTGAALASTSALKGKGTDGVSDPGANVPMVVADTAYARSI